MNVIMAAAGVEYRNVRVAVVQLDSCLGQIEANLAHGSHVVAEAARVQL